MEIPSALSQHSPRIDAQNPWPGLAAYDEASNAFFHGRGTDVAELMRHLRHAPMTVLYGKSGLGKSSLLRAGLFPLLREAHFLPVYLHVDFSVKALYPPFEQMMRRLEAEMIRSDADFPSRAPSEGLWQYLHRRDLEIWSADNFLLTPVLVFDQMEELYSRSGCSRSAIRSVLEGLADLIENRIPPECVAAERMPCEQMDFFTQRYRILMVFREDYLPEFETWKDKMPSLLQNRLRLLPMSPEKATAAIKLAGAAILDEGVAERIVRFLANPEDRACGHDEIDASREPGAGDGETVIEPVLLSLCCYQLNIKRLQAHAGKIDAALVDCCGQNILEAFYHEAIQDMPEKVVRFIEDELIKGDERMCFPLQAAITENFIERDDLDRLINRFRLLRVNRQADTARIELIHDRLVGVVRKARDGRLARAREEMERKLRKDAEMEACRESERRAEAEQARARLYKKNHQLRVCFGIAIVIAILAAIFFFVARDQRLKAIVISRVTEAQAMLSEARIESEDRAFLQLLAAFRILPETQVVSGLLDALIKHQDLVKLMMTGDPVMAAAFSPDGSLIASGGTDTALRLWDAATGQPIGEPLQGHAKALSAVTFSPDGSLIVSGSQDTTLRLWDVATRRPVGTALTGHEKSVSCAAFSPDGSLIVSGSQDTTLRLWDAATRRPVGILTAEHPVPVNCAAFSPDGTRIVSCGGDNTLRIWDAGTGRAIGEPLQGHTGRVESAALSPDGSILASGSQDMTLCLWDAVSGQPLGLALYGHWGEVLSLAFSPDGSRILSGSGDKTLRLWDAVSGKPIGRPIRAHKSAVTCVSFSPDGGHILSGSWDKTLRLRKTSLCEPMQEHTDWVNCVAFSPDGSRIVSGSGDHTLRLWDADTGKAIGKPLKGHMGRVESAAFSPDGSRIVSGSQDTTLRVWDVATGHPIGKPLPGHFKAVTAVAFSPEGRSIVSGSDDCTLRLWDADTLLPIGQPLQGHHDFVKSVAFNPDGTRIVSGSGDKTLCVWDAVSGEIIGCSPLAHAGGVNSVAFSPDGRSIVSGSWDASLRLWHAVTLEPIGVPMKGHMDSVTSVTFSPDGRSIASGSWDASLRLWHADSGEPIGESQRCHDGRVQSVAFSPDSRRIVSGSGDKTLRLWSVIMPADLPGALCNKLTRNMSQREWQQWVSKDMDVGYEILCPDLPISPDEP